jgi:hypothetical protein
MAWHHHSRQPGPTWFRGTLAWLITRSRQVLVDDGYHAPMLFVQRTKDAAPEVKLMTLPREAERALLEQYAASGVAALYVIRESWSGEGPEALAWKAAGRSLEDYPARQEALVIAGVCRTALAVSLWTLVRQDGRVVRTVALQPEADAIETFAFDDLPWDRDHQ